MTFAICKRKKILKLTPYNLIKINVNFHIYVKLGSQNTFVNEHEINIHFREHRNSQKKNHYPRCEIF